MLSFLAATAKMEMGVKEIKLPAVYFSSLVGISTTQYCVHLKTATGPLRKLMEGPTQPEAREAGMSRTQHSVARRPGLGVGHVGRQPGPAPSLGPSSPKCVHSPAPEQWLVAASGVSGALGL